ncbi:hypothetical protein VF21_05318 [Pseudogymnoascus sp. 05NY08]|nr:hypothetical protein VF21_05318 [Pseudogymnoascus sp. 05NY08]
MAKTLSTRRLPPKAPAEKDADSAPKPAIPNPRPSTKKRRFPLPTTAHPPKRLKPTPLNTPPTTKLHIYVFGDGESGELGLGPTPINGNKPTAVTRPRLNPLLSAATVGVVQIAAGGMHCVALTHDQKILTWGVNDDGALGRDTTWEAPTRDMDLASNSDDSSSDGDLNPKECTPTAIPREAFGNVSGDFVQVVALDSASFALTSTGAVYGWGTFRANDGILGFTTTTAKSPNPSNKCQRTPLRIPSLKKIISLAAGNNHILALDTAGRVFSWGTPEQSQLGRRLPRSRSTALTPAPVALPPITKIACGAYHSFALAEYETVYAWGANNFGQTGIPSSAGDPNEVIPLPTPVTALSAHSIRNIAGGEHHSLACTLDGSLLTWGRCDDGQSGIPLPPHIPLSTATATPALQNLTLDERRRPRSLAPTVVSDFEEEERGWVLAVAAGIDNSFAVTSYGTVYAWGFSANYRTGLGAEDTLVRPTLVGSGGGKGEVLTVAECGGQFGVLAGPVGVEGGRHGMSYGEEVMAGPAGMEKYWFLQGGDIGF